MPDAARRPLDAQALAQVQRRLRSAPEPPWLHTEAARRMAERLPVIKLQPATLLDWHAGLGASAALLHAAYPAACRIAVEPQAPAALRWWQPRRWTGDAVLAQSAVLPGSAQLVWANMMLHLAADPQAVIGQWQRALSADGFLMFSTLGTGTFEALTALYRSRGWGAPFAAFVDMHDLGDMLVASGFADPVMDQQTLTLTWADGAALLAELRCLGGNAALMRWPGLRTPRWRRQLETALQTLATADGRPALGIELVFGHAFKAPPRAAVARETTVALDTMRAMVRAGRKPV